MFIKSWNEQATGHYLKPDQRWGHACLAAIHCAVMEEA
ncbi:MAG: glycoside hydrolase family 99-like domain-containing protein [Caldilinea sp.]|nr:glycoside hydrolase family 99-like domain-containing protein [Caldilinea sp.]MCB0057679.1 glycoside hydrolase family 99-like domain-containing protein [Caldilineaceae bacterium]MCW5844655.1 glycoside hydrolase family 99-like domain-containing protein [Caldilinea sp.]